MQSEQNTIHYFAFGSNMLSEVINTHRKVETLSKSVAVLNGYTLVFNARGVPIVEPGFANIEPTKDGRVWGVVYQIERSEWQKIIATEGKDYTEHEVEISTIDGEKVRAITLYATENLTSDARPSQRYLTIVLAGAVESNLPESYIKQLRETGAVHIPIFSKVFTLALNILVKPVLFRFYRATRTG